LEKESRDSKELPPAVLEFLESSSFEVGLPHARNLVQQLTNIQLEDIPGNEQVTLTKKFGDETCVPDPINMRLWLM
jgi:hypothetical protein